MARTETITVADGASVFRLRNPGTEPVGLELAGQLVALSWCDNEGSVARYLARGGAPPAQRAEQLAGLRAHIEDGVPAGMSLATAFAPLLQLLESGTYALSLEDGTTADGRGAQRSLLDTYANEVRHYAQAFAAARDLVRIDHYYPLRTNLVFLQSPRSLDPARIEHWQARIAEGKRPTLVTLDDGRESEQFVLDGHHKAVAYGRLGLAPHVLAISATRQSEPDLSYGDGQALLTQVLSPSLLAHREAQDNYALHTRRRLVCTVSLGAISLGPLRQALSDAGLRDLTVSADGKRLRIDSLPGLPDLVESAAPTTLVGEVDAALSTVRDVATAFEKAARSAGTTAAVQITDAASGDLLQGPRRPSA